MRSVPYIFRFPTANLILNMFIDIRQQNIKVPNFHAFQLYQSQAN